MKNVAAGLWAARRSLRARWAASLMRGALMVAMVFGLEGIDHVDLTPDGGTLFNLPNANAFAVNANLITLEFTGDHSSTRVYRPNGIDGTLGASYLTTDLFTAAGVTAVTASLPSGVASRFYPELGVYPDCQIDAYLFATDLADGSDALLCIRIFKAKLQLYVPSNAGNLAVMGTELQWSSKGTNQSIADAALPGVTAPKKVHYAIDVMT